MYLLALLALSIAGTVPWSYLSIPPEAGAAPRHLSTKAEKQLLSRPSSALQAHVDCPIAVDRC